MPCGPPAGRNKGFSEFLRAHVAAHSAPSIMFHAGSLEMHTPINHGQRTPELKLSHMTKSLHASHSSSQRPSRRPGEAEVNEHAHLPTPSLGVKSVNSYLKNAQCHSDLQRKHKPQHPVCIWSWLRSQPFIRGRAMTGRGSVGARRTVMPDRATGYQALPFAY